VGIGNRAFAVCKVMERKRKDGKAVCCTIFQSGAKYLQCDIGTIKIHSTLTRRVVDILSKR
jgi:hypothetical protein